ncbi:hypothetical protein IG631_08884 [Alternaria alternata]|nr:hypothetical protein IG631_08884 [Alternaria alternata]
MAEPEPTQGDMIELENLETRPDIHIAMISITITNSAVPCNTQPDRITRSRFLQPRRPP